MALLNSAPISTQLHLPPPSSIHLHPVLCRIHNIRTKISHVTGQFPTNVGRKTLSCPFWLKMGSHGMLEVLIANLGLDFKIANQNSFSDKFGLKKTKFPMLSENWYTYIGISRMLIFIPIWVKKVKIGPCVWKWHSWYPNKGHSYSDIRFLWTSNQKFIFGQIWPKKVKVVHFV